MTDTNADLLLNHLKFAIRHGVILLCAVYVLGIITGWGLSLWWKDRPMAIGLGLGALLPAAWFVWSYSRTHGLLHHSGFGRPAVRP